MRAMLVLLAVVLFCGCDINIDDDHPSEKAKLAGEIRRKVAIQLQNELGLIPCGTGGRAMFQIERLFLAFECRKPLDVDTGRKMLIAAVERFAAAVNANEAIRPYLDNYPFVPKNIEVEIFIQDQNGRDVEPGKLCVITVVDGVLIYKIDDLQTGRFTPIYKETYEEALEALEKQNHEKQSA